MRTLPAKPGDDEPLRRPDPVLIGALEEDEFSR